MSGLHRRRGPLGPAGEAPTTGTPSRPTSEGDLLEQPGAREDEPQLKNEQHVRTQDELERSLARFEQLYDLGPVAHLTLSTRGEIVEANLPAAALFDLPKKRLVGRMLQAFVSERSADELHFHLRRVFSRSTQDSAVVELNTLRSGTIHVRLDSIAPLGSASDVRVCLTACTDVTELLQAQTRIRRLAAIVDDSRDAITVQSLDRRILSWNRGAREMYGYTAEQALQLNALDLVPPELRTEAIALSERLLSGLNPGGHETQRVTKGGERKDVWMTTSLLTDEQGRPAAISTTERDITAHKGLERSLLERQSRLTAVLDAASDGIIKVDVAGRIVLLNRAAERMFQQTSQEMVGKPFTSLLSAGAAGSFELEPTGGGGREVEAQRRDGSVFPLRVGTTVVRSGDRHGFVVFMRDLTEERRATRGLREREALHERLQEELAEARKLEAIGRLASGVAHDVNNVFMGIIGCAAAALSMLDDQHPARSLVEQLLHAARTGSSVPERLLGLSRPHDPSRRSVDVHEVIEKLGPMLRRVLGEDVRLSVELGAEHALTTCEDGQIEQILLNLCANARDAMPRGGEISIATADLDLRHATGPVAPALARRRYVVLSIRDTGAGMDEETRARAFEPFFTTKGPGGGTGLGLYTTYAIMRAIEGGVEVQSTLGAGTTVHLYFPAPSVETTGDLAPTLGPETPLAGTILVVEDEPLVRFAVRHYLTSHGCSVIEAASGGEAIERYALSDDPIDLVLTDVSLPGLSGRETAERLCAPRPDLRVVFMSAHPRERLLELGQLPTGATALKKPFTAELLMQTVRTALGAPRLAAGAGERHR